MGRLTRRASGFLIAAAIAASALTGPGPSALGSPHRDQSTGVGPDRAVTASAPSGLVVLVGLAGVGWGDVSAVGTPALYRLEEQGSAANLSVGGQGSSPCPGQGWLTVSAGVVAGPEPLPCQAPPTLTPAGSVNGWAGVTAPAILGPFYARPGALEDALLRNDIAVSAIGRNAALGAADSHGQLHATIGGDQASLSEQTRQAVDRIQAQVRAGGARAGVILVDAADAGANTPGLVQPAVDPGAHTRDVRGQDQRLGAVLGSLPPTTSVIVASLSDPGPTQHLQLLTLKGPAADQRGFLTSRSTRQPGLALLADVPATVLTDLGIPLPAQFAGQPLTTTSSGGDQSVVKQLQVDDVAATTVQSTVPWFFGGLIGIELVVLGAIALARRRSNTNAPAVHGSRASPGARRAGRLATLVAATIPVSCYLANLTPWATSPVPAVALVGAVLAWALTIGVACAVGPWRTHSLGPVGAVSAVTSVVLLIDLASGSSLQLDSMLGLQPLIGGRFYGVGNVTLGVQLAAGVCLAATLASPSTQVSRRLAGLAILVVAVPIVVVDAAPAWGAKFGAIPVLVPALAVLALRVARVPLRARHALSILAFSAVAVAAVCVLDYLKPKAQRGHLGRFVESVLSGQVSGILTRKAGQNLDLLLWPPVNLLIPIGIAAAAWALYAPTHRQPRAMGRIFIRFPILRPTVESLLSGACIGAVLNDTGIAIPPVVALFTLPLLAFLVLEPAGGGATVGPLSLRGRTTRPP